MHDALFADWPQSDRRTDRPVAVRFDDLLEETAWRPTDPRAGLHTAALIANGFLKDRRKLARTADVTAR